MQYLYFYLHSDKISLSLELICENPYDAGWKVNFGENDVKKAEKLQKDKFPDFWILALWEWSFRRKNCSVGFGVFAFKICVARWSRSSRILREISFPFERSSQIKEKIRLIYLRTAKCLSRRKKPPTCFHINSTFHSSVQGRAIRFNSIQIFRENTEACSTTLWTDILGAS